MKTNINDMIKRNVIYHKKDLPNQKGYKFWAVMPDLTIEPDEVFINDFGLHNTTHFKNMIGWLSETAMQQRYILLSKKMNIKILKKLSKYYTALLRQEYNKQSYIDNGWEYDEEMPIFENRIYWIKQFIKDLKQL